MQRREFISFLGGAAAALPLAGLAQPRLPRVGVLLYGPAISPDQLPIVGELAGIGYVDGRNITYMVRGADGDTSRIPSLARELVAAKPDVIIGQASSTALALADATTDIPVVMTVVGDPVTIGVTDSISRPSRNITGFTISSVSIAAKRIELLREIVPSVHKAGYLWAPENPLAASFESRVRQAANALGITLVLLPLKADSDIDAAFARAEQENVSGVVSESDPLTLRRSSSIVDHCLLYGLPCIHSWAIEVRNGALMSYGSAVVENMSRAAVYVDRILKGAKVAELPFEEPTQYALAINLKTAKAIHLTIPPTLLARADEVIE
jgi:putative ABC transport system substrate-binding protein